MGWHTNDILLDNCICKTHGALCDAHIRLPLIKRMGESSQKVYTKNRCFKASKGGVKKEATPNLTWVQVRWVPTDSVVGKGGRFGVAFLLDHRWASSFYFARVPSLKWKTSPYTTMRTTPPPCAVINPSPQNLRTIPLPQSFDQYSVRLSLFSKMFWALIFSALKMGMFMSQVRPAEAYPVPA